MTRPGRYRAPLLLSLLGALSLSSGCAVPASESAAPVGQPGSAGATPSTVTPEPPAEPATSTDGSAPRPDQGVFGRITDAGNPVPGAMVQPAPGPGNPAPEREVFGVSAADGTYGLGLTPGAWDITIYADGYDPVVRTVNVPPQGVIQADATLRPTG